jgi:AraC-like DNA-binding protein
MMLAADRLASGQVSIATVAPAVGYESESAFSAAFKRSFGHSPREFTKAVAA